MGPAHITPGWFTLDKDITVGEDGTASLAPGAARGAGPRHGPVLGGARRAHDGAGGHGLRPGPPGPPPRGTRTPPTDRSPACPPSSSTGSCPPTATAGTSSAAATAPPSRAPRRDRPPTVAYLAQIARAAEDLGFAGALTPTGAWCEDAWLTTAMVSRHTERLKFLVAFRPGFVSPTLAAQMASTFQRHSGGRLLLNVVTGGESHEQRAYGDFLDKDARYAAPANSCGIVRELWEGRTVTCTRRAPPGRGGTAGPGARPGPRGVLRRLLADRGGGRRPARRRVPDLGRAARGRSRRRSPGSGGWPRGRAGTLRFGIRLHVITRDTAEQAWAEADRLLDGFDADDGRGRPGGAGPQRVGGPAADARAARRQPRRPGDPPQPVGRHRPGARRRGHGAGRQPRPRSPTGSRSTTPSASTSSCSPATRTWRRRTGSARASCRGWRSGGCGGDRDDGHRNDMCRAPSHLVRRSSGGEACALDEAPPEAETPVR